MLFKKLNFIHYINAIAKSGFRRPIYTLELKSMINRILRYLKNFYTMFSLIICNILHSGFINASVMIFKYVSVRVCGGGGMQISSITSSSP